MKSGIAVVDLFAGPGGLSEGFSSLKVNQDGRTFYPFRIALSVEKEAFARATLRLRAFYRLLVLNDSPLDHYYAYLIGAIDKPYSSETQHLWDQSGEEALQLTIGAGDSRSQLHDKVRQVVERNRHWILIGGPPCQAYSLVGRARNKGKKGYRPEEDHRHFLYEHYLELIRDFRPSAFVMENVKGILSSKVSGSGIFARILEDLRAADSADDSKSYSIYSLVKPHCVYTGPGGKPVDPRDFIVRSELYGIPQARHRVILVGIRNDFVPKVFRPIRSKHAVSLFEAIGDLPKLRSGLSKKDSLDKWKIAVRVQAQRAIEALRELHDAADRSRISRVLKDVAEGKLPHHSRGGLRVAPSSTKPSTFARLMQRNDRHRMVLNHEARGHMEADLSRYLYAIAYAKVRGESPSQEHFPVSLAPDHKNWFSGKFADRFRVQIRNSPSTTITSHIAKDGHYYVHFDPKQCRSLTVREAARLQTFPDNYFFEGTRTEQYIQVGNAVPPLLASQIAKRIWSLFGE
jgi:DNA (cytosine-5)-methyltransferase 1